MRYLNLGCGNRYHPEWTNIDIAAAGPDVIAHDLTRGIPFPAASCDVVYHSNVLEHIRRTDALVFLRDCHRVLKPGGIVRIAVPDLEQIAKLYLQKLEVALRGDAAGVEDYEWVMLELYDQFVRECSGGGMAAYLRQDPLPNEAFVYERIGEEGRNLVRAIRAQKKPGASRIDWSRRGSRLPGFIRGRLNAIRYRFLARLLLGSAGLQALEIGRFRLGGEVHHWAYDRFALAKLLRNAGFPSPLLSLATESLIPDWQRFNLDAYSDGTVIKPDSLFMEARKVEEG